MGQIANVVWSGKEKKNMSLYEDLEVLKKEEKRLRENLDTIHKPYEEKVTEFELKINDLEKELDSARNHIYNEMHMIRCKIWSVYEQIRKERDQKHD